MPPGRFGTNSTPQLSLPEMDVPDVPPAAPPKSIEIAVGAVYRMRRVHPCGGWEWRVVRVGADIGMVCLKCERHVLVERRRFESRMKALVPPASG